MNHRTELEIAILALMSFRDAPIAAEELIASLRKHNAFDPEAIENIGLVLESLCSLKLVERANVGDTTSRYGLTPAGRAQLQACLV